MSAHPSPATRRGLTASLTAAGACVTLLQLVGAFRPSGLDWGFHALAFLPAAVRLAVPIAMAALLVPGVQRAVLGAVGALAARLDRLASPAPPIALGVLASVALFWFARLRFFLL